MWRGFLHPKYTGFAFSNLMSDKNIPAGLPGQDSNFQIQISVPKNRLFAILLNGKLEANKYRQAGKKAVSN
jgi:hypothetical protein